MREMVRHERLFSNNATTGGTGVVSATTVTADGLIGSVPAGWMLEMIVYNETGGADIEINLGTTAGGAEISTETITASIVQPTQYMYNDPALAAYDVYISDTGAGWGASSLDIYLILRKVV